MHDALELIRSGTPVTVVDLETTGGSPRADAITEIGAIRLEPAHLERARREPGQLERGYLTGHRNNHLAAASSPASGIPDEAPPAEFTTLVDPHRPINDFVSNLTGITDALVSGQPDISAVLPQFCRFAAGSVLVAHNAPFDIGFLQQAASSHALPWPAFPVLDTVRLARQVLHRGEVPNCKLATLAAYFAVRSSPSHRALADARATAVVLTRLLALAADEPGRRGRPVGSGP